MAPGLTGATILSLSLLAFPALAREVVGWLESAQVEPEGIRLRAKLDTGADTTSLGASDIRLYSADGSDYVAFRPQVEGTPGPWIWRPLARFAEIRRHEGPPDRRPVVRLWVCLERILREVEVTLADRSNFSYPLLLGRNFLAGELLVDSTAAFTTEPSCRAGLENQRIPNWPFW
jgi:hypothetical protein